MRKVHFFCVSASLYEIAKLILILLSNKNTYINSLPFSWFSASPLLILPFFFCIFLSYNPKDYVHYFFPYILTKIMALISSFSFVYQVAISEKTELLQENFIFLQQFIIFILLFFIIDAILLISFSILEKQLKQEIQDEKKWTD